MIDEELKIIINGCIKQKRLSQNELYKKYFSYAMSICFRYVSNREEALSIVNAGYLKIFNNIKKFDTQYDIKPWLKTIMVNTAINHVKKMKKYEAEIELEEASGVPTANDILSKINYDELLTMIHQLSLAYRTVFNMHVLDGYKHEEIATKLGITVSTSKSNLTRAKANLREMIQNRYKSDYNVA